MVGNLREKERGSGEERGQGGREIGEKMREDEGVKGGEEKKRKRSGREEEADEK